MSFPALLYTAAAVAFFILMINRPVVEPPNANMQVDDTAAEQTDSATALTISAAGQASSAATEDSASTNQPEDSATNSATDASTSSSDANDQAANENSGTDNSTQTDSAAQTTEATETAPSTDANTSNSTESTTQTASAEPDYARERRISNEIRDAILEGEIFYLNDGSRSFMSIQTNADERRGGALILHGRGFHPDWEDTVNPLRTGLAENGWTTLSLQMPVLEKDAKYYDYVPLFAEAGQRIQAGIRHLKQQGISPITIVAHSCGAHMAMQWVRDNGDADIAAYVGLGMGATDFGQQMTEPFPLDDMQVPVFDVYGEDDFPAVIKMAPDRWKQITTAGNPASAQRMLPEADHYFKDKGDELVGAVSTWLNGLKL